MRHTKYKILLVEDAKIAQKMAREALGQLNCEIDIATTGAEAIEHIKQKIYDIIFMDLGLPDMDGFSTTEGIRKYEKTTRLKKSTPIIALTAHEGDHIEITCRDHDMNDFLVKPLTEQKALEMLKKYAPEDEAE